MKFQVCDFRLLAVK